MKKTKYTALYNGLAQIPVQYLKSNLLPALKDPNSKLLFSGSIANKDGI